MINHNGENSDIIIVKHVKPQLRSVMKVFLTVMVQVTVIYLGLGCTQVATESLCVIYSKNDNLNLNYEQTSGKPKLRAILQNNWPALFKNVKIMKDKEFFQIKGN